MKVHSEKLSISSEVQNISIIEKMVDDLSSHHKIHSDLYGKVLLAVIEGVNNAVVHGNKLDKGKIVTVEYSLTHDNLSFSIRDQGAGFDPKIIPELIEPILKGEADAVFGSRMMKKGALVGGMPLWKHNVNILLTALENVVLGTYLTEYHSGFRAYSARYLKNVPFMLNSDGFIFDTEIIVQGLLKNMRIEEVPIRTRYFDEASTIKFWPSVCYGLGILKTLLKAMLHRSGLLRFKQFQ